MSVFLVMFNIPLFLYGLRKQGIVFTVYAIFTVMVYAVIAWLITDVLPVNVSVASPLAGTDLFLLEAKGYNSNENKTVLYAVVNQFQIVKLKTLIKSVDKDVYVTITMVSDILHSSQELK